MVIWSSHINYTDYTVLELCTAVESVDGFYLHCLYTRDFHERYTYKFLNSMVQSCMHTR